ncbi:MAG: recombinase family protein [Planctomycetes bacterium]|nr:recombinase family protein [Planctomycetota bacterium]
MACLKGTMSEAELHILKSRLQQGLWNKAARGAVLNHAPIGYVRTVAGDFVMDPDEPVQAVTRLIFAQFQRRGSVNGLLRWLVRQDVKLPVRPHFGANRGELEWRRPNRVTLLNLLHHPIYAGAYRWGHREVDPRKKVPGRPTTGRTFNAHDECRVLIQNRFPAYITWDEFETNQRKLAENSALGKMLSAPRHGPSVLAGLVVCGRCGRRMLVSYANITTTAKTLRYGCLRDAIEYGAMRVKACRARRWSRWSSSGCPPKRSLCFTKGILSGFLRDRGVRTGPLPRSVTKEQHLCANEWWLADLAAELAMPIATLHRWQRVGWVTSRKVAEAGGRWAIYADADELLRLRRLRDEPRSWPQPYPAELITPKPRTEETATTAR